MSARRRSRNHVAPPASAIPLADAMLNQGGTSRLASRLIGSTSTPSRTGGGVSVAKIQIDRLTKFFGEAEAKTQALADFSLTVAEGEFICVVGPSGCGKTSTLRMIAGHETVSDGDILLGDR